MRRVSHRSVGRLTPEEEAIGDPDEESDEIDDTLPADLWFAWEARPPAGSGRAGLPKGTSARRWRG